MLHPVYVAVFFFSKSVLLVWEGSDILSSESEGTEQKKSGANILYIS